MASPLLLLISFIFLVFGPPAQAKPGASPSKARHLDTTGIHQTYIDGDFDEAIDKIETALKYGGPFSHEDSVFIFKHLGVMYTAKYETREKGKQCMMRLLQVEPTARIMDMYASDMIYMIFKNIQDEYEMSKAKLDRANKQLHGQNDDSKADSMAVASNGKNTKDKAPKEKERTGRSKAWMGWTAGALAAAGGVALLIHMNEPEAAPSRKENSVP